MTAAPAADYLVVGLGSRWRSDDAAGLLVAEQLAALHLVTVEIRQFDGPDLQLLELWRSDLSVFLVDAVASGAAPGTIHCLDLLQEPQAYAAAVSSHTLELGAVVKLARVLSRLPRRLVFYGIEAGCLAPGAAPSATVTAAIAQCARLIVLALARPA
jgi:hydrogenase maturation protease